MSVSPVEWAALIGVGGAVAGAMVGGVITFRVTDRQVRAAATEGALQRDHERDMAREQREQDRKADAFLRIMTFTAGMDLWARWKIGALNGHRDTPEPQPPPPAEIMTTTALSNLYLSSAGERLLKDYFDARTNLSNAIGAWEKVVNPANVLAGLKALESLGEATQALREQLRAELEATRGGDT